MRSRSVRTRRYVEVAALLTRLSSAGGAGLGERASSLPRLIRATMTGEYPGLTRARLLMLVAAAGYVASPVDLLPESVLGAAGLADDAAVLTWLASRLINETDAFLEWEANREPDRRGRRRPSKPGSGAPGYGTTVRGEVID